MAPDPLDRHRMTARRVLRLLENRERAIDRLMEDAVERQDATAVIDQTMEENLQVNRNFGKFTLAIGILPALFGVLLLVGRMEQAGAHTRGAVLIVGCIGFGFLCVIYGSIELMRPSPYRRMINILDEVS